MKIKNFLYVGKDGKLYWSGYPAKVILGFQFLYGTWYCIYKKSGA
jgi:hypothetical protein